MARQALPLPQRAQRQVGVADQVSIDSVQSSSIQSQRQKHQRACNVIIRSRPGCRWAASTATCDPAAAARWPRKTGPPAKHGVQTEPRRLNQQVQRRSCRAPVSLSGVPCSPAQARCPRRRQPAVTFPCPPHLAPLLVDRKGGRVCDTARLLVHVVHLPIDSRIGEVVRGCLEASRAADAAAAERFAAIALPMCAVLAAQAHNRQQLLQAHKQQHHHDNCSCTAAHLCHRVLQLREALGQREEVREHLVAVVAPRRPKVDQHLQG